MVNLPVNAGDADLIAASARSLGNGNPLQYSCVENPTEDPGRPKGQTQLSTYALLILFYR